ncbi:MAG: tetratricopeptide repeat protein [Minwuia sp.]|uniref:tetratricopeptide repeat protein n=1 Tax=Minwuia sp. TaxID=2493630 RepID=UPI003A891DC2
MSAPVVDAVEEEIERIESERRRRQVQAQGGAGRTLLVAGVGLAAFAVECLIVWLLWNEFQPIWLPPVLHLLACAAAFALAWYVRPGGSVSRFMMLMALSLFFMGPIGPPGVLFAMVLHAIFRRSATPFDEWYQSLFPEEVDEPSRKLYEMLTRGLADAASQENVTSFTDVLQYGSIEQKRAVISLLSRDFRPEFAPALQSALADPNPAVRVQAATAAANIEGDFLERAIELETAARRAPNDSTTQIKAARHFDDYAFSGILDGDRQAENRRKAETYYRAALDLDPESAAASLGIGRLLVRLGRLQEAEDWFEAGFDRGLVGPAELTWYLEATYRLGDLDRLRYAVAGFGDDILADPRTSERLRDVIRLWMGKAQPSAPAPGEMRLV